MLSSKNTEAPAGNNLQFEGGPEGRSKKRWLKRIALVLVVLIVIALGGAIYLQSGHAIRTIYLPIASEQIGAEIGAGAGSVSILGGSFELEDFTLAGADGETAVSFTKLEGAIDLSTLSDEIPAVKKLVLTKPVIHLKIGEDGGTNFDYPALQSGEAAKSDTSSESGQKAGTATRLPSIRLDEIAIQGGSITVDQADGSQIALAGLNLDVNGFAPDKEGTTKLGFDVSVVRPEAGIDQQGTFEMTGGVTQWQSGEKVRLYQNLTFKTSLPDGSGDIVFEGGIEGCVQADGGLHQEIRFKAATPAGEAGQITGTVNAGEGGALDLAVVEVSNVSREFLNPFLAAVAPVQLAGGELAVHVSVRQEEGVFNTSAHIKAQDVSFLVAGQDDPSPAVTFVFDEDASVDPLAGKASVSVLKAGLTQQATELAQLKLEQPFEIDLGDGSAAPAIGDARVSLVVNSVTIEQLRPWLALAGVRDLGPLTSARLASHLDLTVTGGGEKIALTGEFGGDEVKLEGADGQAVKFGVKPGLSYGVADGRLDISGFEALLQMGGNRVASLELKNPMTLDLADTNGAAGADAAAELAIRLENIGPAVIGAAMAVAGAGPSPFEGGVISGEIDLIAGRMGADLGVKGQVRGEGLKLAGAGLNAIDFTQDIEASLSDFARFELPVAKLAVKAEETPLANLAVMTGFDLATGPEKIEIAFGCPAVLAALEASGVLPAPPEQASDGALDLKTTVAMSPEAVDLDGAIKLAGVKIKGGGGSLPLDLDGAYKLGLRDGFSTLAIDRFDLTLAPVSEGGEAGKIAAAGEWPLAGGAGELTASVCSLDLAPWLILSNALANESLPPIIFEAEEKLTRSADGKIRLAGEARCGLPAADGTATQIPVALRTELEQLGDQIETLVVEFTGKRSDGGADDHATLTGSGEAGGDIKLELAANVESLRLNPYLAFAGVDPTAEAAEAGDEAEEAAPAGEAPATTAEAEAESAGEQVVHCDIAVGRLQFGEIEFQNATGRAVYENGYSSIEFTQSELNGGPMTLAAEYDAARTEPRYSWQFDLDKAAAGPIIHTFKPEYTDRIDGTLSGSSSGAGEGTGADMLRRIQSESAFEMTDGYVREIDQLKAIAEATGIDRFNDINYSEFDGALTIENGAATFDDWQLDGSEVSVSCEGSAVLADGSYELSVSPWVSPDLIKGGKYSQYLSLLPTNGQNLVKFPLKIGIKGQGSDFKLTTELTVTGAAKDAIRGVLENPSEGLGGLLGGSGGDLLKKLKK